MKHRKVSILLCWSVIPLAMLQVRVVVQLHTPPPGQLQVEDMWWVDLDNQDNTTYRNVWLHGEVHEKQKGLVYRANSNQFDLPPGRTTKRLRDIRLRDQWYQQGYEAFFFRSGTIPEGNYTYIVSLLPELGADTGHALVRKPGPPRLIAPRDGAQLGSAEKFPMFSWTPPQPSPPNVRYVVRVVEILPGQTKEEAMRSNSAWHAQKGMRAPSLRYPQSAKTFEKGRRYAWQVRAMTDRSAVESEVWEFSVGGEEFLELGMVPHDGDTVSSTTVVALTGPGLDTLLAKCVFLVSVERGKWIEIGCDEEGSNGWSAVWPTFRLKSKEPVVSCLVKVEVFTRSGSRLEQVNRVSVLRY